MGDSTTAEADAWATVCPILISLAPQLRELQLDTTTRGKELTWFYPFLETLVNRRFSRGRMSCTGSRSTGAHHDLARFRSLTPTCGTTGQQPT